MAEDKTAGGPGHRAVMVLEDGSQVTLWVPGRDLFTVLDRLRVHAFGEQRPVRLTVDATD